MSQTPGQTIALSGKIHYFTNSGIRWTIGREGGGEASSEKEKLITHYKGKALEKRQEGEEQIFWLLESQGNVFPEVERQEVYS